MTNPFSDLFPGDNKSNQVAGGVSVGTGPQNPFADLSFEEPEEPDLSTGKARMQANYQSIATALAKIKATVPKNEGHKARLDKLAASLEMQLEGKDFQGQSGLSNFGRGLATGVAKGLQFPVELAGAAAGMVGATGLRDYVNENSALLEEQFHARGKSGMAGEIVGTIAGSVPGGGAAAHAVGAGIRYAAPSTKLAKLIAAGVSGSRPMAAVTNVVTGLPINAVMAAGAEEMPIPEDATPEERDRLQSLNTANKIKQFAIGVGADALFGAAFHSKLSDVKRLQKLRESTDPADKKLAAQATAALSPERKAQLEQVEKANKAKQAVKRSERIAKARAQAEWQIMNPDAEWKELKGDAKKKIYADWNTRNSNTKPNTSPETAAAGLDAQQMTQLEALNQHVKKLETERDEAVRAKETDDLLGVGSRSALEKAKGKADADEDTVYIFFDVNGMKNINDSGGMQAGDQLLRDSRDAIMAAHGKYGIGHRLFRWGGDEIVAVVKKEHAQTILETVENTSHKVYGDQPGSTSGAIFNTLDEAETLVGKTTLTARKLEAKARQGIRGRDGQEQALIDAIRERQNTQPAPVVPASVAGPEYTDPFPPEAMHVISEITQGGGLNSDASKEALAEELVRLYSKADLDPDELARQLQELIEDFTPLGDEMVTSYRGEAPETGAFNPMGGYGATEGEGTYLTGQKNLAEYFSGPDGRLIQIEHVKPKKPLVVEAHEPIPSLDPSSIVGPPKEGESEWIRLNREGADKAFADEYGADWRAGSPEEGIEPNGGSIHASPDVFSKGVTDAIKAAGYDAVHVKRPNGLEWTVILDENLVKSKKDISETINAARATKAREEYAARTKADPEGTHYPTIEQPNVDDLHAEVMSLQDQRIRLKDELAAMPEYDKGRAALEKQIGTLEDRIRYLRREAIPETIGARGEAHTKKMMEQFRAGRADLDATIESVRSGLSERGLASIVPEAPKAPKAPKGKTSLETVEVKKPLEAMSDTELDKVDDQVLNAIEEVNKQSPEYAALQRDLDAISIERANRKGPAGPKAAKGEAPLPEGVQRRPDADYTSTPIQQVVSGAPPPKPVTVLDKALVKLRGTSPRKMTDGEIELHLKDLENQRESGFPDEKIEVQKRIDKVLEERAFRDKARNGDVAQVPPNASSSMAGFLFGVAQPISPDAEEEQKTSDRITNGLMWAGVGLGAGLVALRMRGRSTVSKEPKPQPSDVWRGSEVADAKLVSRADVQKPPKAFMERAREWYTGVVRRSYAMDRATATLGGGELSASKNPAKLMSMFGRWVSQAEGALMDKPAMVDFEGNVTYLDSPAYREIAAMVGEDLKGLGKLMAARASVEGEGLRKVPFDPITAQLIIQSAPENYHQAADAMRKFDLAMAQVLESSGVLAPGSVERFSHEEFYAALHKVFDPEGAPKITRDAKGKVIVSPNPIKGRKGGTEGQIFNPAETSAAMVPQIYRAAELATIKNRLVDLWEAAGRPKGLLEQVERRKLDLTPEQQLRVDALRQEVKGLGQKDAEQVIAAFDPRSLDSRANILTVHREGVLRSYRIAEGLAESLGSLHPDELDGLWKVLGIPAGIARTGVVLNPYFVAKQAFIDNWQAFLNTEYGFRPGVDQFIGWMNIVRHTPEYKNFLAAGGGHSSLQSGEFANVKSALKRVTSAADNTPLGAAIKNLKEFNLVGAYKNLILPVAEAARVGEYLRARGDGASVLDGVYAAKHVTANFQQRGGFTMMRGLDRASMFLNPALQGLDQAAFRAGINPFRAPEEGRKAAAAKYLSKAFVSITLPSMYFWMANKDDQEITDLRKTVSGAKFWFMRSPVGIPKMGLNKGDIIKIPKPIVDGQMFGTSMESAMDKMYADDPEAMHRTVEAMGRDIGFNLLPTMGVLYYGLSTGKNLGTGGQIIPRRDENLEGEHQGEDRASWLARKVSKAVAPAIPQGSPQVLQNASTPAGLDYVINTVGGMLGQDAMLALTQAVEAETKGYVPAKDEFPIVSKVFARYPTANVEPIRTFYDRAEKVQEVSATMKHLLKEDPERLVTYMASNQGDIALVGLYDKNRQTIANFSKAIQDLKDAPVGTYSSEDRRMYEKQFLTMMIDIARQTNVFARQIDKLTEEQRSASQQSSPRLQASGSRGLP